MLPAFGAPECKAFLTLFQGCAESVGTESLRILSTLNDDVISQLCNRWMDAINSSKEQSAVLNIPAWMSRATLDAIGEGKINILICDIFPHPLQLLLMFASAPLITRKSLLHVHITT